MTLVQRDLLEINSRARRNYSLSENVLQDLKIRHDKFTLYKAGLPTYPRTFTRDVVISALLMRDTKMLKNAIEFGAHIQGKKKNPLTGEQPGVIFHEYDIEKNGGVEINGRLGTTLYAASDTTGLFLLAHEEYLKLTNDKSLSRRQKENIRLAGNYILKHLNEEGIFEEDPKFAGGDSYSLKVTYWKDSMLFGRKNGEPAYPVVYPLAHVQNMIGLRSAARLLQSYELYEVAEKMRKSIDFLFNESMGNFPIAIDMEGEVRGVSSDGLNMLFYLEPGDISDERVRQIIESSRALETQFGYQTLDNETSKVAQDKYHANTVWTHEQAQIHMGAVKHLITARQKGNNSLSNLLSHAMDVSFRVYKYLKDNPKSYPELFVVEKDSILPGGNDPQLWAVAAKMYFEKFLKSS